MLKHFTSNSIAAIYNIFFMFESDLSQSCLCTISVNVNLDFSKILLNFQNFCVCENGWRGDSCEKCRPYWRCPNQETDACVNPNQCICNGTVSDPDLLCGNTFLNNAKHQTTKLASITTTITTPTPISSN